MSGDGSARKTVFMDVTDREDAAVLLDTLSGLGGTTVVDVSKASSEINAIYYLLRLLLVCFVALVALLCAVNVFNTIAARMNQRARELSTLRSVGMTSRQQGKMLALEILRTLLNSVLLGAVFAAPVTLLLDRVMRSLFGSCDVEFPVVMTICAVVGSAVVIAAATAAGLRRAGRESVAERLRNENN